MENEPKLENQELLSQLEIGSFIAYGFAYGRNGIDEINVGQIQDIKENIFYVPIPPFYVTYAKVKPQEVLAIGNNASGKTSIPGWEGKYDVVRSEELNAILVKIQKKYAARKKSCGDCESRSLAGLL